MMKNIILLVVLASCATHIKKSTDPVATESPAPTTEEIGAINSLSNLEWVIESVRVSNCIKNRQDFYSEIATSEFTENNGKTSAQIANELKSFSFNANTYSRITLWNSKELATYSTQSNAVLFRIQKHPRTVPDHVETIFHESMHLLKYFHVGNYNNNENQKTVPYKIGSIARKYVGGCL